MRRFFKVVTVPILAMSITSIYGCNGKKDISVMPQISWILASGPVNNPESFRQELVDWFVPFKNEACPNVRFYPQIVVIRLDGKDVTRDAIVAIDPRSLAADNQNFVQKIFGAKPEFNKLINLFAEKIKKVDTPATLTKPMGTPQETDARLWEILAKKPSLLIAYRDENKLSANDMAARLKSVSPEIASAFVSVGADPDIFRDEVAKRLCDSATKGDKSATKGENLKPIYLVSASRVKAPVPLKQPEITRKESAIQPEELDPGQSSTNPQRSNSDQEIKEGSLTPYEELKPLKSKITGRNE